MNRAQTAVGVGELVPEAWANYCRVRLAQLFPRIAFVIDMRDGMIYSQRADDILTAVEQLWADFATDVFSQPVERWTLSYNRPLQVVVRSSGVAAAAAPVCDASGNAERLSCRACNRAACECAVCDGEGFIQDEETKEVELCLMCSGRYFPRG